MLPLLLAIPVICLAMSPPSPKQSLDAILDQFDDYDLILHLDNITSNALQFATNRKLHIVNYHKQNKILKRPSGRKFMNIVYLENPFTFEEYTLQPFNLKNYDFVFFIIEEITDEFWKMNGLKHACATFIYVKKEKIVLHCCYYCGNLTASLRETDINNLRPLLHNYTNFNGHTFQIAYTSFHPFFWIDGNDNYPQGAEGRLLQEFSRVHNFQFKLVEFRDKGLGAWESMVEAVKNQSVDWAVGGISATLERGSYTDFTRNIKYQGFAIMYAANYDFWSIFEFVFLIFSWPVWIFILMAIIVICIFAKFANDTLGQPSTCFSFITTTLVSLFEQTISNSEMKFLKFSSLRVLFTVWWLCSMSIISIYKSQVASILIQPIYSHPKTIDVLANNDFQFLVHENHWSFLKDNLQNSLDKVYIVVLNRIQTKQIDFCQLVSQLQDGQFAIIDEDYSLQHKVFTNCPIILDQELISNLRLVTENIFPNTYHAWCMPLGTPYGFKFSKTIGRMDDYGLISYWYKSASSYKLPRNEIRKKSQNAKALTLFQLLPSFVLLVIGLFISFLVLLVELYLNK